MIGGFGLWVSSTTLAPILIGIVLGAILEAWVSRSGKKDMTFHSIGIQMWRTWALGGGSVCLFAYLVEFFPTHLAVWELRVIHPLYGLCWIVGVEALALARVWLDGMPRKQGFRDPVSWVIAVVLISGIPLIMWFVRKVGILSVELSSWRLDRLPDSPIAPNILGWIERDGFTLAIWAAVVPLVLVPPAIWLIFSHRIACGLRAAIAVALGPVLVAAGFACRELSWWNGVDSVLLALVVPMAAALCASRFCFRVRCAWVCLYLLVVTPGAILIIPKDNHEGQHGVIQ